FSRNSSGAGAVLRSQPGPGRKHSAPPCFPALSSPFSQTWSHISPLLSGVCCPADLVALQSCAVPSSNTLRLQNSALGNRSKSEPGQGHSLSWPGQGHSLSWARRAEPGQGHSLSWASSPCRVPPGQPGCPAQQGLAPSLSHTRDTGHLSARPAQEISPSAMGRISRMVG
uniref:Uncharacterized protein n=1 Tax=Serinus canaria TaxID=9135 RepID=A0A8C9UH99_SERCA